MGEGTGVVRQAGLSANPTLTTWLRVEPPPSEQVATSRTASIVPFELDVMVTSCELDLQPQQQRHHYDHIATTEAAAKEHAVLGMMILPECHPNNLDDRLDGRGLEIPHNMAPASLYARSNGSASSASPPTVSTPSMLIVPQPINAAKMPPTPPGIGQNPPNNGSARKYQCKMCPQAPYYPPGQIASGGARKLRGLSRLPPILPPLPRSLPPLPTTSFPPLPPLPPSPSCRWGTKAVKVFSLATLQRQWSPHSLRIGQKSSSTLS
ncbi:hypothetical protein O3P69_013587 [Scylla paramamosain]|uniref:Uncharacterized protein n=1 Tax=Scylla paramamosain TaxID=85552 RepID=A0AAW0SPL8_SCYPA